MRRPCADREEKRVTRGSAHPARKQEQLDLDGKKQEQLDLDGPNQRGLSEVLDWRLHDLRRTMVSGMARLGVAPHIADKILNHASGTISGVAAVYQRHEFLQERRNALHLWGEFLADATQHFQASHG